MTTTGAYENTAAAVFAVGKFATSPSENTFEYLLCLNVSLLTSMNPFPAANGFTNSGAAYGGTICKKS